jgi:hypothetical protein
MEEDMTSTTAVWLCFGMRFSPHFTEAQVPDFYALLDDFHFDENDIVILGSAYGFDSCMMDYLSSQERPPRVLVVSPFKGATQTWPQEAAQKFLGQAHDMDAIESWLSESHQVGVYTARDKAVVEMGIRYRDKGDVLKALVLWPGNPGVLQDAILGAVAAGAELYNLFPYLPKHD